MREIKFRGRKEGSRVWDYGSYSKHLNKAFITSTGKDSVGYITYLREVTPETVGQYTGLKDKNGAEIYEGDIVISCGGKDLPCVVEYNQDRCEFIMKYDVDGILHIVKEFKNSYEVIGNIHDNPELLEVDE